MLRNNKLVSSAAIANYYQWSLWLW